MGRRVTVERTCGEDFETELTPQSLHHAYDDHLPGRLSLQKVFRGDLAATSTGEMLSAGTGVAGSAGYMAIERVTGRLDGRSGTFVLQHSSTLDRGTPFQSIALVPDSRTGELDGLAGSMTIEIDDDGGVCG